ncbi:MAG: thiamine biosynthesis protein ApbE [Nitrospirae bacterium RBG_19FT_COMBO_58_9]|nr:MAG: thiamine biosynthesis protein ApbE [Nitrospirae bacterium RBG_19FT_COMBO_58_9]
MSTSQVGMIAWCFLLVLLVGSSCAGLSSGGPAVVVKRTQMHMGTLVSITAVASTDHAANRVIDTGFQEIKRLEHLLSTWIPESELSRVNASAGVAPVMVSLETLAVVRRSIQIAELTEGAFNIAIGPAIDAWKVTEQSRIPPLAELEALKSLLDLHALHADVREQTIYLEKPGMRIDVGGIGKGYAADQAVTAMKKAGALAGVVALSGDIKTFGQLPDGRKFPVGIQHPRKEGEVLAFIDLQDEAISTAGDYERFFERDGVRYHHILDPKTLQPARGCQSVTVIAKEGVWADGLDTGIFVMGPERGMELVERLPDVEAIIVGADGRLLLSSGLQNRVRFPAQSDGRGQGQ